MPRFRARRAALLLVAALAVAGSGVPATAQPVIPPGQEDAFADLLGRGHALPAGCAFAGGRIEQAAVIVSYHCAGGEVVLELRHPDGAPADAPRSQRFALVTRSGEPPAALLDALLARMRAGEGGVAWQDGAALEVRALQVAWTLLLLAAPLLCWRAARAAGVAGGPALLAVGGAMLLAGAITAPLAERPLHANGHAWREAREALVPAGASGDGMAPFLHGQGGTALQWLLTAAERRVTGGADPFRISRVGAIAAAGATALLALVLCGSAWGGAAAGGALALMPLQQMLALSGSTLAIAAWMLPWSLALLLAAARSGDRIVLAGAALAGALATLSHTAMLAWPAGLAVAWLLAARPPVRWSVAAFAALAVVAAAWLSQLLDAAEMLQQRNAGASLLTSARIGLVDRNLFMNPQWVSPVLLPLALAGAAIAARRGAGRAALAVLVAAAIGMVPFFAVMACSSDAVRYQGALLGLPTALAAAGLWLLPLDAWAGGAGAALVRVGALAALALLPMPSQRQPLDPAVLEHQLVADTVPRLPPDTLIVLPGERFANNTVIVEFPDFLLPPGSRAVRVGDAEIAAHRGPLFLYLGLACISFTSDETGGDAAPSRLRPECEAVRAGARPWAVRELTAADLPRDAQGWPWTFHRLALDQPFGFFAPVPDEAPR